MLGKLILILLQVIAAWFLAPHIRALIPGGGSYDLFLYAIIFAIIVYLTGVIAAQVLRDVGMPSTATLTTALIVALLTAAVLVFLPGLVPNVPDISFSNRGIVLAGAIIGYLVRR